MFDSEGAADLLAAADETDLIDIVEDVIAKSALPAPVRTAPLTYRRARIIDADEVQRLTDESLNPNHSPEITERLEKRRAALTKVIGRNITCAMVRLPGCVYTMEVDTAALQIAHWEYQQI